VLRLALATVRARRASFAGSFLAVLLAVMLITACMAVLVSTGEQPTKTPRLSAAAAYVTASPSVHISGSQAYLLPERPRLDASLASWLGSLPGVRAAVPDLSFPAALAGQNGQLAVTPASLPSLGHPWSSAALTPFHIIAGHAPATAGQIAIDAGLASNAHLRPGDQVLVATQAGPAHAFVVCGIAAPPHGSTLPNQSALFFADATAATLAGAPGKADAIGIFASRGVSGDHLISEIRAALTRAGQPGARALTARNAAAAESPTVLPDYTSTSDLLTPLAVLAGIVAAFALASTFSLAIVQRMREFALLRAVGATQRQVRRMVLAEAFLLGLAAIAAGVPLGFAAASGLTAILTATGLAPSGFTLHISWLPALLGAIAGLIVPPVAAQAASRRAARARPAEALRAATATRQTITAGRLALGGICLASVAAVTALFSAISGQTGALVALLLAYLLAAAFAFLAPLAARPAAALLTRTRAARDSAPAGLAAASLRTQARRFGSVIAPVVLATTMAGALLSFAATQNRVAALQSQQALAAQQVIIPADAHIGLPDSLASQIRYLPGVAATTVTPVPITVSHSGGTYGANALALNAGNHPYGWQPQILTGTLAGVHDHGVALESSFAAENHMAAGDQVTLWLPDGHTSPARIAATYRSAAGSDMIIPTALIAGHTRAATQAIYITGTPTSALAQRLAQLTRQYPTAQELSRNTYLAGLQNEATTQNDKAYYLIAAVITAFAMLSMANTFLIATAQRRREFALLRLVGATSRQVLAMTSTEAALTIGTGMAAGSAIALGSSALMGTKMAGTLILSVPAGPFSLLVLTCAGIGLIATLIPVRAVLRARPAEATG
jgi:putative ABC transport system permease protein